ncbi:p-type atpase [Stylonychia lemnae]|uniref:Phospholipid-transporting ATPase n=1 Tax=Stylonychia lemnae TaxID=5949 RepID=A0A078B041_STYLE|nr:p-type atpase [Stylonychia lemnae]|eukprot:CDW86408.1 p-type atpase [Stylonychia lemnae]
MFTSQKYQSSEINQIHNIFLGTFIIVIPIQKSCQYLFPNYHYIHLHAFHPQGTFLFVLVLTMLREGYEDYQRYKMQNDLNSKQSKIKAGQIIKLDKDSEIPADILTIYSTNISGLVFVDTMALDGETNLKEKMAICETFDEKGIANLHGEVTCDAPNELLDYWEGFVNSQDIPQKAPCTIKNLMLRGSYVRNTTHAYGIVMYTGMQTKILKNLKKPPHKVSNMMKKMNQMLYTVFVFQVGIVVLYSSLNYKWAQENFGNHDETGKEADQATFVDTFLIQLLVFWVAYSHLIPISLYVIIELLKLGQSALINRDIQMYDKENKSFSFCRNSDLIEELGQVEMIFSDKTGTLTMNKMIFKKCQINGERMGDIQTARGSENGDPDDGMSSSGIARVKEKLREESKRYYKSLKTLDGDKSIYNYPHMNFAKVLALCHTVVCDNDPLTKEHKKVHECYNLKNKVTSDLNKYSSEGLRTLVMAMRQVPEEEYQTYYKIYSKLVNSNSPYKDKKITELYMKMEKKLRYLGCTAIEDKLQDGVPQTIAMLIKADIRFWMLTGDKLETAIEIAKSCRIILEGNQVMVLSTNDFEILNRHLDNQIEILGLDVTKKVKSLKNFDQQGLVIAIDGSTLSLVLEDPELEQKFFYVSLVAKSVICCRVSPKQKADVVSLYKKRGSWVTLSIGDGANDVSMILEANIGIGIKGKEGTQAVRNADYAICQFRYIQKLILVHGHWGYRRVSKMICYYFYKNVVLVFTELYFALFNGFSGQIFFVDWLPMLYNAIFTSWPCLFAFNFEQDINPHYIYKHPVCYKSGQLGIYFNFKIFWKQILLAIWHGLCCFFIPMMNGNMNPERSDGSTSELWLTSTITFTIIIHLVSYKLFLESSFWNVFSLLAAVICVLFYYVVCFVGSSDAVSSFLQPQLNGMMMQIFSFSKFYLMVVVVPAICLIPDSILKLQRAIFNPLPSEKIMMEQKKNPTYSYFENIIKNDLSVFITDVFKKNKSQGHLTSKALSEMEKQSVISGVLSPQSSFRNYNNGSQNETNGQEDDKNGYKANILPASHRVAGDSKFKQNSAKKKFDQQADQEKEQENDDDIDSDIDFEDDSDDEDVEENEVDSDEEDTDQGPSQEHEDVIHVEAKVKNPKKQGKNRLDEIERSVTKKQKKMKQRGNETTHHLLNDSNVSDNEILNESVSSKLLQEKINRDIKKKKLQEKFKQETQDDSNENESNEQEESSVQETIERRSTKIKKLSKDKMREQSYKERKKKLLDNIKKEMKQKKDQEYKMLQASYHSTKSNNHHSKFYQLSKHFLVMEQLNDLAKEAEKKNKKEINPNAKFGVKDHLFAAFSINGNNQPFGSQASTTEKNFTGDVPYLLNNLGHSIDTFTPTPSIQNSNSYPSTFQLPPERIKEDGHPLERAKLGQKNLATQKKTKKKKYVMKYRELIAQNETQNALENQIVQDFLEQPSELAQQKSQEQVQKIKEVKDFKL